MESFSGIPGCALRICAVVPTAYSLRCRELNSKPGGRGPGGVFPGLGWFIMNQGPGAIDRIVWLPVQPRAAASALSAARHAQSALGDDIAHHLVGAAGELVHRKAPVQLLQTPFRRGQTVVLAQAS